MCFLSSISAITRGIVSLFVYLLKIFMDTNANRLNWFEIPATDIKRAKQFYETIFGIEMGEQEMMNMKMAFFPSEMGSGKANGGLCQSDFHKPAMDGVIVYLNGNPDLQTVVD